MEKSSNSSSSSNKKGLSIRNLPGISSSRIEEEAGISRLVGGIVEKGFSSTTTRPSDKNPPGPFSLPRPTVIPFPVARHRSHGPHWAPLGSQMQYTGDVDGDNEDKDETDFDPISSFANPIHRKQKKSLNFSRWRELVRETNGSTITQMKGMDKPAMVEGGKPDGERGNTKIIDKRDNLLHQSALAIANGELPENSNRSSLLPEDDDSTVTQEKNMEGPTLVEVGNQNGGTEETESGEKISIVLDTSTNREMEEEQHNNSMKSQFKSGIAIKADSFSGFRGSMSKVEQDNLKFSPNPEDIRCEGPKSIENQIDAENRVRLQQMSAAEIAEAQAEIMEKMKPGLVGVLKKRGLNKLQKQKTMTSDLDSSCQLGTPKDENHVDKAPKGASQSEVGEKFHIAKETAAKDKQEGHVNGGVLQMLGTQNSLWNAWSERVESVRTLRFSLDGTILENAFIQVSKTGDIPNHGQLSVDNVTERDFLRTEGDPGALGYTVKEAIAMTRSMVPAQRAIALQVLGTVLDKALCNLQQSQVGCNMSTDNNIEKNVDWKAVLAFVLGPEPELVLSLRMALDDNHTSVVLACAKVILCALSCDINENVFDISEKMTTFERAICTAPIFRSKPGIDVGFLCGGFWKYSTKPSNILPSGSDIVDDENEEEHTIQDDIVVAGQDFAAGLVRMGVLPRIRYLLETHPSAALEECLISILVGIARHSLTCVNAIMKCERLVQVIVDRFSKKDSMEIHLSRIKFVTLLKVLAQSDKKICIGFVERGVFQDATWQLYRPAFSLDHWIKSGKEYCKLTSALMVEQLRFWRVCIQYGCCVSYFADFFQALCLWLSPPTFDKLIEMNVLSEFASISQEAYLVLGALAKTLPKLHSQEQLRKQNPEFAIVNMGNWCWSYVGPTVELAMNWISLTSNPYLSKIFDLHKGFHTNFVARDSSLSCILWVISSVMHMLSSILERVAPDDTYIQQGSGNVPWLPDFVPKVGLQIVKSRFLNFSDVTGYETVPSEESFFVNNLCHLRHESDNETSLSSTSCLNALVRLIVSIDKTILVAKNESSNQYSQENSFSRDGKILEDGIIMWSQGQLRNLLITFMELVALDWNNVQSIETFGRGGPAPGIGFGWGASGGGFWSTSVLLAQEDSQLLVNLLEIFQMVLEKDLSAAEDMAFTLQRINSALGVCLTVVPRGKVIMEKALDILLGAPVLKSLGVCVDQFLRLNRRIKSFDWEYKEEDYLYFGKILTNHFRNRWLCVKKSKAVDSNSDSTLGKSKKNTDALDTIHEDLDESDVTGHDSNRNSLVVEWAHQRLPLPMHWFLSPISTISDRKAAHDLPNVSSVQSSICSSTDEILEVAKGGIFLLFGLEAMALCTDIQHSPVSAVSLVWKLHSLSMVLLVRMDVIEDERSRDVYRTLQELYGQYLDESRSNRSINPCLDKIDNLLTETGNNYGVEYLKFQSDVHESYPTFIETFVEQFASVSYGDVIYGRQVAMYLHCAVEAPVRLATWNALSSSHVLELLPPLDNCLAKPEGYLEPIENNEGILEAYVKSWISGALDRAATRGSMAVTLALHHLSSFIFHSCTDDKLLLRNKLVKSLLRDYSRKQQHEGLMLDFIQYTKSAKSQGGALLPTDELERRFKLLTVACEGNSSLLTELEKLKSSSERR
ncbi:transcriptional elongation regulator MINIYO [Telopea speciosissima]|uniref:transcriptional elongation regulator MINIYO n=1 Tax=Telopea speciosissima TaxID=54955 RepID=UPI001CC72A34|nr:transcriptional elongation regulator MINIYO [Telopea speciosissima]